MSQPDRQILLGAFIPSAGSSTKGSQRTLLGPRARASGSRSTFTVSLKNSA